MVHVDDAPEVVLAGAVVHLIRPLSTLPYLERAYCGTDLASGYESNRECMSSSASAAGPRSTTTYSRRQTYRCRRRQRPGAHEVALTRQLTQSTAQLGFRTNGSAFCLDSCDLARSLRELISTLEVRTTICGQASVDVVIISRSSQTLMIENESPLMVCLPLYDYGTDRLTRARPLYNTHTHTICIYMCV